MFDFCVSYTKNGVSMVVDYIKAPTRRQAQTLAKQKWNAGSGTITVTPVKKESDND